MQPGQHAALGGQPDALPNQALAHLRIASLLAGTRGEAPIALDGYVAAALALGRLMTEASSRIESVDINPFLVGTGDEGGMALDAVVLQRDEGTPR